MKKILSILLLSVILFGCSENRVLIDQLTKKNDIRYDANGPFNGIAYDLHGSGALDWERSYKDGKLNGLTTSYWKTYSGTASSDGAVSGINDDDRLYMLEYTRNYKDGERDGLSKHWGRNGQLSREENYKDGKLDGLSKHWGRNGQLLREENYKDGQHDGLQRFWHENGQLYFKLTLKDGKLDGNYMEWDEKGIITADQLDMPSDQSRYFGG